MEVRRSNSAVDVSDLQTEQRRKIYTAAYLCRIVREENQLQEFSKTEHTIVKFSRSNDPEFMVCESSFKEIFICFPGTNPKSIEDLWTDIRAYSLGAVFGGGKVHSGIHDRLKKLPFEQFEEWINANYEVVFCGHSLGGAIAHLSYLEMMHNKGHHIKNRKENLSSIAFGTPCFADENIKKWMKQEQLGEKMFTIINREDCIARILSSPAAIEASNQDFVGKLISYLSCQLQDLHPLANKILPFFENFVKNLLKNTTPLYKPIGYFAFIYHDEHYDKINLSPFKLEDEYVESQLKDCDVTLEKIQQHVMINYYSTLHNNKNDLLQMNKVDLNEKKITPMRVSLDNFISVVEKQSPKKLSLGHERLGKSSFARSFFGVEIPHDEKSTKKITPLKPKKTNENLDLTIFDCPGFGIHMLEASGLTQEILQTIKDLYKTYETQRKEALKSHRNERQLRKSNRLIIDCCIYFLQPHWDLTNGELNLLKEISLLSNIIVVIGKADCLTAKEQKEEKDKILAKLADINLYQFKNTERKVFTVVCAKRTTVAGSVDFSDRNQSDFMELNDLLYKDGEYKRMREKAEDLFDNFFNKTTSPPPSSSSSSPKTRTPHKLFFFAFLVIIIVIGFGYNFSTKFKINQQ